MNPQLQNQVALLRQRWQKLAPRERLMIQAAFAVIGFTLIWWVGISPAVRTLEQTPKKLSSLDEQLQVMQKTAMQVGQWRGTPAIDLRQAHDVLQSSVQRLGSKAEISFNADQATLNIKSMSGESLWQWLQEARSGARARPVQMQLSRNGKDFTGTVVLSLSGANP